MIDPKQLRDLVIYPILDMLQLDKNDDGKAACQLLLGTAMQESGLHYLSQISGPALGLWQMEPATFEYLSDWIRARPQLDSRLGDLAFLEHEQLAGNLYLACAYARFKYYSIPAPLPSFDDIEAQAAYYKQWYNTPLGAATTDQYLANWKKLQSYL